MIAQGPPARFGFHLGCRRILFIWGARCIFATGFCNGLGELNSFRVQLLRQGVRLWISQRPRELWQAAPCSQVSVLPLT